MIADIRHALRMLMKAPGFTIIAVLTLALGIGSSTTIFSVVNAVLLRPLPYPQPERIVELREVDEKGHAMSFAEANFDDLVSRSRSFAALARYNAGREAIAGGIEPVRETACVVSPAFFQVLGVKPLFGHFFASAPDAGLEAIVSYGFWKRSLGGRASLEGTTLRMEDRSFAVIGVLPPEVEFPPNVDVWFSASLYPKNPYRTGHGWSVAGRLRDGVSPDQAGAEIAAIGQHLKREQGALMDASSFGLMPLRERMVKNVRPLLLVLCAAVALLLVISFSNAANLFLVRTTVRRKEIALRAALGASRWRLIRQFIAESILLSVVAAGVGVLFAYWGVDLILGLYHGDLPRVGAIGVDATVLLVTFGISILLGILLALVPAMHISRRELQTDLQGARASSGQSSTRFRNGLIIVQVALTLMLLVGAGLLGRSFQRLLEVNPGFQPESTVAMTMSQGDPATPSDQRRLAQFYERLLEHLHQLPGVFAVGGIDALPMSDNGAGGTFLEENGSHSAQTPEELVKQYADLAGSPRLHDAEFRVASANYFSTMRIPLLRGRLFASSDGPDSQQVALVSQELVRRYWPNENPIGKQLQFGGMDGDLHLLHVIGVVGDVHDDGLDARPRPTVYVNYLQRPRYTRQFSIVLRAGSDPATLIAAMRQEALALDPEMPTDFQTLQQLVSSSLDSRRFSMVMLGAFAGAALVLAMVGLYGIMAYITSQRTMEIGIRMALGGQRADMLRMILRQSFTVVGIGMLAGVIVALAATRLLATLLYGVEATDLATYGGVVFVLAL
ncbi:MAG: ABC transporter permease, partial [Chthoniobacterales bacterium]|nr:ABC transporter permease [Chthoniobacterales bacterium]